MFIEIYIKSDFVLAANNFEIVGSMLYNNSRNITLVGFMMLIFMFGC